MHALYGLRCVPSIARCSLLYTAEKNLPDVSLDVTERVGRDMFVGNLITRTDNIEEGKQVVSEVSKLLPSTGFRLTKWNTSNREILSEISDKDLAPARRDIVQKGSDNHPGKSQTTLDLIWDTEMDKFFLKKLS